MAACPHCHMQLYGQPSVCPHCGANTSIFPNSGVNEPLVSSRPKYGFQRWSFPVVKLTFVLWALGMAVWWFLPTPFPKLDLRPSSANATGYDPCKGKDYCVIVFMAPWCSACKATMPIVKSMMRQYSSSTTIGIKPVIGRGRTTESMEKMAAKIGTGTFIDPAGQVMQTASKNTVPHWFVIDSDGTLKKEMDGVIPFKQAMISQLGLDELDDD